MAKHRFAFDEAKVKRYLKEGRGKGDGQTYKPWLSIQDVPSLGRSSRIHGFTTGREHHLLSDLETGLFFLLEWCPSVTDIREQFPLDREVTRLLANEMGVTHPRDPHTKADLVMTTDFVVDLRIDGRPATLARAVKPSTELDKKRTIEKLEIERRYWAREGVAWNLVTERELPEQRIRNIRWLHQLRTLDHQETPHPDYWPDRCHQLLADLRRTRRGTIEDFLKHLEKDKRFSPGEPLTVLRHLASNRVIEFDMDREFSSRNSITSLRLTATEALTNRRSA